MKSQTERYEACCSKISNQMRSKYTWLIVYSVAAYVRTRAKKKGVFGTVIMKGSHVADPTSNETTDCGQALHLTIASCGMGLKYKRVVGYVCATTRLTIADWRFILMRLLADFCAVLRL